MATTRKSLQILILIALVAALAGCNPAPLAATEPPPTSSPNPPTPTATLPTNPFEAPEPEDIFFSLEGELGQLPEGIAADGGDNVYVSLGFPFWFPAKEGFGEIRKIGANGQHEVLTSFPGGPAPAGIAVSPFGHIYFAYPNPMDPETNGVYEFREGVEPHRLPGSENIGLANGIVLTPSHMYVSDSVLGAIWRIPRGGTAALWLQHEWLSGCDPETDPVGANGIVVERETTTIYIANTARGLLLRISPTHDGTPGELEIVAGSNECDLEMDGLDGMDGIAMGPDGSIYALLVMQHRLVKIDPDSGKYVVLLNEEDGLHNPASITLSADQKSLYLTNYALLPPAPAASLGPGVWKITIEENWPEPAETVPAAAPQDPTPEPPPAVHSEQIAISYDDRIIRGTLVGEGDVAVILAPMFNTPRGNWMGFAKQLAAAGYTAVAFDLPGSAGTSTGRFSFSLVGQDTEAVYKFLRERGHERIICMGASLGADGCFQTSLLQPELAGFVILSAYTETTTEATAGLLMPKLLVSGQEVDVVDGLKAFFEVLPEPKQLEILDTTAHGTDIFSSEKSEELRDLLMAFIEAVLKPE